MARAAADDEGAITSWRVVSGGEKSTSCQSSVVQRGKDERAQERATARAERKVVRRLGGAEMHVMSRSASRR